MELKFTQVDVFTETAFGGNPLAVFTEGDGVPPDLMQPLAKEMNLSETTFVLTPESDADVAHVRIFTPGQELPFAGHPTIGTAWVLATQGRIAQPEFSFREAVGSIPVRIEGPINSPTTIWMTQPLPQFSAPVEDRSETARRVGVDTGDLLDIPIRIGSAGVPFLFIGLKSPDVVDRVSLSDRDLSLIGDGAGQGVFVFAPIEVARRHEVHSRMLGSHGLGIVEDPATGGASGPLGAHLIREGVFPRSETVEILSRQGYAMGRPSDVRIRMRLEGESITQVEVGGAVVPVLEGTVRL